MNLSSNSTGTYIFNTTQNATTPTGATTVSIPGGSSSVNFFYGDTKAGSPLLTAHTTGITSATQNETINAATPALSFGTSCASFDLRKNKGTATTVTRGFDSFGNAVTVSGTPTVTLSGGNGSWNTTVSFASGSATATNSATWTNVNTSGLTATPTAAASGFVSASCSFGITP